MSSSESASDVAYEASVKVADEIRVAGYGTPTPEPKPKPEPEPEPESEHEPEPEPEPDQDLDADVNLQDSDGPENAQHEHPPSSQEAKCNPHPASTPDKFEIAAHEDDKDREPSADVTNEHQQHSRTNSASGNDQENSDSKPHSTYWVPIFLSMISLPVCLQVE